MSVSYGGDKITFDDGTSIASGLSHFRNRIINGAMEIDQRYGGSAVTITNDTNFYTVDRWQVVESSGCVLSAQQITDAPATFQNSIRLTVTTAASSIGAAETGFLLQRIEGFNVADLAWGTASAKTISLSFWVKSSVTGNFSGSLKNAGSNRSYPFSYTISSANTWEYKTITIPGDTTGTWAVTTGVGVGLTFDIGSGSNRRGTAGAWAASNFDGVTGAASIVTTLNATWQITGVQFEVGSSATTFERRPYGTELQLCQRYFQIFGGTGTQHFAGGVMNTNRVNLILPFLTQMRASPSFSGTDFGSAWSNFTIYYGGGSITATGTNENYPSPTSISFGVTHAGSTTAGQAGYIYANSTNARLSFSAEL